MNSEILVALAVGFGLSASCGFRVFVPLLGIGLAARFGGLPLAGGFEWMAADAALAAFAAATILEILAYYVPWMDNVLDTLATPAAVIAGVIASAAVFVDLPPLVRWSVAIIGGGSAAGLVQGATVLLRAKSSLLTAGLGNPVLATVELAGSMLATVLALFLPALLLGILVLGILVTSRLMRRPASGPRPPAPRRPPA
jgi:hypothetical protein